ncbi:MAG: FkbM family methyltransferase [Burkholderiales bacterium]
MHDLIRKLLRRLGFELHRYTIQTSPAAQRARLIERLAIDLVLDVGANAGQYAKDLRAHGYSGRIVSFEPLASAHASLARLARSLPGLEVAPRMALGESEGEITLHVAGNSLSSSVLAMLPEHEAAAPGSAMVGAETVSLRRLDQTAGAYLKGASAVLLKLDTQGYEDRVLDGATGVLGKIAAIQTELSVVPLYAGQLLFDDMRAKLDAMGFTLVALFPGYVHAVTGQTLQIDGFFVRSNLAQTMTRNAE